MLDAMRRHSNSWLTVFVFGAIIFVFAVNFGPWQGMQQKSMPPYAARINGYLISIAEFQMAYRSQFYQMQQFFPNYTEQQAEQDGLKHRVLERLMEQELLAQLAKEQGLSVPDDVLAKAIQERLFKDKPFDRKTYKEWVQGGFHVSEKQFEDQIRREILAEQAVELFDAIPAVSKEEIRDYFIYQNHRMSLQLIQVPFNEYSEVALLPAEVENIIKTDEKTLSEFYYNNLNQYRTEKKIQASQIKLPLLPVENKKKLESIRQDVIVKKQPFGGDNLGVVEAAKMDAKLFEALNQLGEGEMTPVIETEDGFYVLKADAVSLPVHKAFEDVKQEVATQVLKLQKQKEMALSYAKSLISQMEKGVKPEKIKLQKGKYLHSGWVKQEGRFIPGMGPAEELIQAAFGLKQPGTWLKEPVELKETYVVGAVDQIEEADLSKLSEQEENIKKQIGSMKSQSLIKAYLEDAKKKAHIQKSDMFN